MTANNSLQQPAATLTRGCWCLSSRVMRSNLSLYLAVAVIALVAVSCAKSREAVTREDQEKMFSELFGFEPPKTVVEIAYRDVYNRHLMDGAWGRWMRFKYDRDVFSRILRDQGYKQRDELHFVAIDDASAPAWWPKVDQSNVTIYLRSDKNTPEAEGYSFEEYVWRDTNSSFVYYFKRYWN